MAEPATEKLTPRQDPAPNRPSPRVRGAHWAVAVAFTANGALLGTWAPRIPEVQSGLGAGHAMLGFVLFALAAGSLTAMPLTGWLLRRHGSARVLRATTVAACLVPGLAGAAAGSVPTLWPSLFLWGATLGAMDVAMNAQAVTVQQAHPRTVINGIHACFSLGGLLGAAAGSAAAALDVPLTGHLAVTGVLALAACVPLLGRFLPPAAAPSPVPDAVPDDPATAGRPPGTGALVLLCAAAFAAMLAEGASADWSAVRLRESGVSLGAAGLGYTLFACTMLLGRALGDPLARRFGHARTVASAAVLGCAGTVAGFAAPGPVGAAVAFGALGLGLSCLMPFLFTAAGEGKQGTAIAVTAVSTSGYVGLLAGPTLIGAIAELTTLAQALWLLPALLLLATLPTVLRARAEETS